MEILSPAGSMEALYAAVQSGADAVYIGGTEFSARRSAANFTISDIEKALRYCHIRGVKLHVAANILIKEKEKYNFLEYIGKLNELGVDAVIIQDIGMAAKVRQMYPDLPLHASTQMTVTNLSGALKLQDMGFSRIVLARELSRTAIKKICENVKIETEVFAHGALCMCYSGQCLLSSIIGGRSGNRGMCAQPCRLPYELDGKAGYFLSPKDLCMIDYLKDLSEIGVTSLKIEGRLKRKEYVACVTRIYKKYAEIQTAVSDSDKSELLAAFNRSGFTSGYFEDKLEKNMMSLQNPSNISENIFSDEVKNICKDGTNLRKREVFISANISVGKPVSVSMWDNDGNFAEYIGAEVLDVRRNGEADIDRVKNQLIKLGNTPFFAKTAEVTADSNVMVSVSQINDARRNVCKAFEDKLCEVENRCSFPYIPPEIRKYEKEPVLVAEVTDYEQAKACIEAGIKEIYSPLDIFEKVKTKYPAVSVIAKLPPIMRDDRKYGEIKADKILVSNIGEVCKNAECYGDYRLNITNSDSADFYRQFKRVTLSPELNLVELSRIAEGNEIIAYGRLPLMVMENCPLKSAGKCQNGKLTHVLRDRKGQNFPLKCNAGCCIELLNSKPIYMADKMSDLIKLKINALRLIFTVENFAECGKIIGEYRKSLSGEKVLPPFENTFTRGHFYRGTE
ncbi:MAG: U32 family peptidase [Firmicutes bacterium]|nr:U32 family peptidase [Bacillota bacterium]